MSNTLDQFESLLHTVLVRLYERRSSDAAFAALMYAQSVVREVSSSDKTRHDDRLKDFLQSHIMIQPKRLHHLEMEYRRDTIIVAVTLFDSFLTDLTRFLLLHRPRALPKERQIRMANILDAGSFERVITGIVDQYVHELAYKKLRDRIDVLCEKFGLDIEALESRLEELQSFANLRNELVHTVSRFQYSAGGETGKIEVQPRPPRLVSIAEAERALSVARDVIVSLAEAIGIKLFDQHPKLASMIRLDEEQPET